MTAPTALEQPVPGLSEATPEGDVSDVPRDELRGPTVRAWSCS